MMKALYCPITKLILLYSTGKPVMCTVGLLPSYSSPKLFYRDVPTKRKSILFGLLLWLQSGTSCSGFSFWKDRLSHNLLVTGL